ncbi:MAG: hypothetical protein LBU97_03320, partial [Alistipes sp.]|nr:hypothetical protein [Alistipes sp.]
MKYAFATLAAITLMFSPTTGNAAEPKRESGIVVAGSRLQVANEELAVELDISAEKLPILGNGQLTVEFAIETPQHRLVLPTVVYASRLRALFEARRRRLSQNSHAEPYHIYDRVKTKDSYRLDYRVSVPLMSWMSQADLTWRIYTQDCRNERLSEQGVLVENIGIQSPPVRISRRVAAPEPVLAPVPAPVPVPVPDPAPVPVVPVPVPVPVVVPQPVPVVPVPVPAPAPVPVVVPVVVPKPEPKPEPVTEPTVKTLEGEVYIDFEVNGTEILPDFRNNEEELARLHHLLRSVQNTPGAVLKGVSIEGHASPEGNYEANEWLSYARMQALKTYIVRNFDIRIAPSQIRTSWGAEDWNRLAELVRESNIAHKEEILNIIRNVPITEG